MKCDAMGTRRTPGEVAGERMRRRGAALFTADWERVTMIHLDVDRFALEREVPFGLDTWEGRACVTLVAFTMRGMAPVWGGWLGATLFRPIATHRFLNVRTYVREGGESGIHFLAEWLSSALAVRLGPPTYGLPYRHGRLEYDHTDREGAVRGEVRDTRTGGRLAYRGTWDPVLQPCPCEVGSESEWRMERYTACTERGGRRRYFRVWHEPWLRVRVDAVLEDRGLLVEQWPWMAGAKVIGADYSPGLRSVRMGWPRHWGGMQA